MLSIQYFLLLRLFNKIYDLVLPDCIPQNKI